MWASAPTRLLPASEDVIQAELVTEANRLPYPNFLLAVLLAALPTGVQIGVGIGFMVVAYIALSAVHGGPQSLEQVAEQINPLLLPLGTLTTVLFAVGLAAICFGRQTGRRLGWRNCALHQWIATLLLVLPLAIIASEVGNLASELVTALGIDLLESLRESNSELFSDFVHQSWWLVFIGGCVLPGLGEEIYCRGFMGRGLVARYGVLLGSIATSLLFGAMHLEPVQATSAFVLGLGLHYLFLLTRSLPTAVVLHTLNNFSAFLVMRYEDQSAHTGSDRRPGRQHRTYASVAAGGGIGGGAGAGVPAVPNADPLATSGRFALVPRIRHGGRPAPRSNGKAVSPTPHALLALITLVVYGLLLVALVMAHQTVPPQL